MTPLLERQTTFARTLALFQHWMLMEGYSWILGDAWRSTDELACGHCGHLVTYQGLLVYNKKSKQLKSPHTERCALDLILVKDGKVCWDSQEYRPLGEKWESLGGRWGGRFGVSKEEYVTKIGWDAGHFEL